MCNITVCYAYFSYNIRIYIIVWHIYFSYNIKYMRILIFKDFGRPGHEIMVSWNVYFI